jgi:deoxyuridine 5'-triphosphate nucleotidohydrolase
MKEQRARPSDGETRPVAHPPSAPAPATEPPAGPAGPAQHTALGISVSPIDASEPWFLPRRTYPADAGYDLVVPRYLSLPPGQPTRIGHNIRLHLPAGRYGLILPRSSSVLRGILVQPGTIDEDYTGELTTIVYSLARKVLHLAPGERVSHLLIMTRPETEIVDLTISPAVVPVPAPGRQRGDRGFGSSGE